MNQVSRLLGFTTSSYECPESICIIYIVFLSLRDLILTQNSLSFGNYQIRNFDKETYETYRELSSVMCV